MSQGDLVKVYILCARLPGSGRMPGASLDAVRVRARERLEEAFACAEAFGLWVAVDEGAAKVAEEVGAEVRSKLEGASVRGPYGVRALPAYLRAEDAKELLEEAARWLEGRIAALRARAPSYGERRGALRRYLLRREIQAKEALLGRLREALAKLG